MSVPIELKLLEKKKKEKKLSLKCQTLLFNIYAAGVTGAVTRQPAQTKGRNPLESFIKADMFCQARFPPWFESSCWNMLSSCKWKPYDLSKKYTRAGSSSEIFSFFSFWLSVNKLSSFILRQKMDNISERHLKWNLWAVLTQCRRLPAPDKKINKSSLTRKHVIDKFMYLSKIK